MERGLALVPPDQVMQLVVRVVRGRPAPDARPDRRVRRAAADTRWRTTVQDLRFPDKNEAWRTELDAAALTTITEIQRDRLEAHGYERLSSPSSWAPAAAARRSCTRCSRVTPTWASSPTSRIASRCPAFAGPMEQRHLPARARTAHAQGPAPVRAVRGRTGCWTARSRRCSRRRSAICWPRMSRRGSAPGRSGFFEERARVQDKPLFLHKFTGWPRSGFLQRILPDARFVNVVRDGRAVANSFLQMPWWRGYEGPEGWGWGPLPEEYQQIWEESGRSFAVLAGLEWRILMEAFEAAQARVPDDQWMRRPLRGLRRRATGDHGSHPGVPRSSVDAGVRGRLPPVPVRPVAQRRVSH